MSRDTSIAIRSDTDESSNTALLLATLLSGHSVILANSLPPEQILRGPVVDFSTQGSRAHAFSQVYEGKGTSILPQQTATALTSGTGSGVRKVVSYNHADLARMQVAPGREQTIVNGFGWHFWAMSLLLDLARGRSVYIGSSARAFNALLGRLGKVDAVVASPNVLAGITGTRKDVKMAVSTAGPLTRAAVETIGAKLPGAAIYNYYGATETWPNTIKCRVDPSAPEDLYQSFNCASLDASNAVRIRRSPELGSELGEVQLKNLSGQWVSVNDFGALRPDSRLDLKGRWKDRVRISDKWISPSAVTLAVEEQTGGLGITPIDLLVSLHARFGLVLIASNGASSLAASKTREAEFGAALSQRFNVDLRVKVVDQAVLPYLPNGKMDRRAIFDTYGAELLEEPGSGTIEFILRQGVELSNSTSDGVIVRHNQPEHADYIASGAVAQVLRGYLEKGWVSLDDVQTDPPSDDGNLLGAVTFLVGTHVLVPSGIATDEDTRNLQ